jgi:hypothetical protein
MIAFKKFRISWFYSRRSITYWFKNVVQVKSKWYNLMMMFEHIVRRLERQFKVLQPYSFIIFEEILVQANSWSTPLLYTQHILHIDNHLLRLPFGCKKSSQMPIFLGRNHIYINLQTSIKYYIAPFSIMPTEPKADFFPDVFWCSPFQMLAHWRNWFFVMKCHNSHATFCSFQIFGAKLLRQLIANKKIMFWNNCKTRDCVEYLQNRFPMSRKLVPGHEAIISFNSGQMTQSFICSIWNVWFGELEIQMDQVGS